MSSDNDYDAIVNKNMIKIGFELGWKGALSAIKSAIESIETLPEEVMNNQLKDKVQNVK